jgi:hypothetical protein
MSTSFVPRRSRNAVQVREGSSLGLRVTVVILELFVGIGGIFGGLEMIRHPLNPLGMTTKLIAGSPFDTYTWPGILLLVLVGLAPCLLAVGVIARWRRMLELSGLFGIGLMAWIVVQWALLADRLWLQPVIFGIGAVITGLAARAMDRRAR